MKSPSFKVVLEREKRFGGDVSDISVYICLIDIKDSSVLVPLLVVVGRGEGVDSQLPSLISLFIFV